MKIIPLLLGFTIKDWLIVITLFILFLCILKIRKLKKAIAQEVQRRLTPQLILELVFNPDNQDSGFYLKNESFFLAQDIQIEDVELNLDDYGFKLGVILRFEKVSFLRPQERIKLEFKALDKKAEYLPDVTERILPHLISLSFKVKIYYSNIEGLKFCAVLSKIREKFHITEIKFS